MCISVNALCIAPLATLNFNTALSLNISVDGFVENRVGFYSKRRKYLCEVYLVSLMRTTHINSPEHCHK